MENTLNKMALLVHQNAVDKGFHQGEKNTGEMLCLIHSEVSEALEADRVDRYLANGIDLSHLMGIEESVHFQTAFQDGVKDTFEDELADTIIRTLDLAVSKGIDIESHVLLKMRYNETRPAKHGKNY